MKKIIGLICCLFIGCASSTPRTATVVMINPHQERCDEMEAEYRILLAMCTFDSLTMSARQRQEVCRNAQQMQLHCNYSAD